MRFTPMKNIKTTVLVLLGAAMLALCGCNTMKGLGQDTERAGEKIQEKASR
jgi:predicted small secreted protein